MKRNDLIILLFFLNLPIKHKIKSKKRFSQKLISTRALRTVSSRILTVMGRAHLLVIFILQLSSIQKSSRKLFIYTAPIFGGVLE